jgi:hypothetical protein
LNISIAAYRPTPVNLPAVVGVQGTQLVALSNTCPAIARGGWKVVCFSRESERGTVN